MQKNHRNRKRDRNKRRAAHPQSQPAKPHASEASQASKPIVRLPFLNLADLSRAEIATARHLPLIQCASCDGTAYLTMAASWRNAKGVAYLAVFCGLCIKEADTPAQKEPYEIELRIDLALFESAGEKAIAEGGAR